MLNKMCNDCTRLHRDCDGTTCQVWDGCLLKKTTTPICKPKLKYQGDTNPETRYRVELWYSYDGGDEFEYHNAYKEFPCFYEAEEWRKSKRENLKYDMMYECPGNGVTISNTMKEEHGDYQHIAHIDDCGMVHWYVDEYALPKYARKEVYDFALRKTENFRQEFLERGSTSALRKIYNEFLTAVIHFDLSKKTVSELYELYLRLMCRKGYCKPIEM